MVIVMKRDKGQTLRFVTLEVADFTRQPDGWKMRAKPDKIWWRRKLGDLCWKVLMKLNALDLFMFQEKVYDYGDKEAAAVGRHFEDQLFRIFDNFEVPDLNDFCLVLGGQQFFDITGYMAKTHGQMITIPSPEFRWSRKGGYEARFTNFPIHVVPWLDGACLIPKVIVERLPKRDDGNPIW